MMLWASSNLRGDHIDGGHGSKRNQNGMNMCTRKTDETMTQYRKDEERKRLQELIRHEREARAQAG
jgi:hypothetical protein